MSVALFIRNINPDCDKNAELLVVTLDDNNAIATQLGLAPYPNASTRFNPHGQVYWFPRVTQAEDNLLLLNQQSNDCHLDTVENDDYLWFCELDQAG